jgi:hypothetical protein
MDDTIKPHGVPWVGFKRPGSYRYYAALRDGERCYLSGRSYLDTGRGWRVLDKPISRRKRKILAKRAA